MVKLRVSEKIGRLKLKAKINLIIISMIIPIVILTFLSLSNLVLKVNSDIDKRFEIAEKSIKRRTIPPKAKIDPTKFKKTSSSLTSVAGIFLILN